MVQAGQYVTDGTAVFLVTDIRDGAQVGDIKLSPILRNGYVKANGALLTSASTNYPRLVTFITDNPSLNAGNDTAWGSNKALYVYDSSADTLRVPDATGRVLQGGSAVESKEAGLPNVTGKECGYMHSSRSNGAAGQTFSDGCVLHNLWLSKSTVNYSETTHVALYDNDIDASLSNPIYSASTTVQPPALTMIPQIKY